MTKKIYVVLLPFRGAIRKAFAGVASLCPSIIMLVEFILRVMLGGYCVYASVKRKRGIGCHMIGGAYLGTGDYYCAGLYLEQWLKRRSITSYALLTPGGSEEGVTGLFPFLHGHRFRVKSGAVIPSDRFIALLWGELADAVFVHVPSMTNGICGRRGSPVLQGYRGLSMTDYYNGFFQASPELDAARFEAVDGAIDRKTILLSPYTTGNAKYAPPMEMWVGLSERLKADGHTVLTNVAGNETPIPGTQGVFIPYSRIVPYLNSCTAFIGVRSGLCEIISRAECAKIIVYTRRSEWYEDGMMLPYTGLNNMGLCRDAAEVLWDGKTIVNNIIKELWVS